MPKPNERPDGTDTSAEEKETTAAKDTEAAVKPVSRNSYGMISGIVGIVLNLMLFGGKITTGLLSGSIAVIADAINNLTDAGSSILMLFGFRMAGQKADSEHPFGHGRIEYIAGLGISFLTLLMGFELLTSSFDKILHPVLPNTGIATLIVLGASILVKMGMFLFNSLLSGKIASETIRAAAMDSLSDCLATTVVLISAIVAMLNGIAIDGWCGLAVALFILWSGGKSMFETVGPLLGQPPSPELIRQIEQIVRSSDVVIGIHDLIVHNYGPGRLIISLHAEVPADGNFLELHDEIDNIERTLSEQLDCQAVIHMDPIETNNEQIAETRAKVAELVKCIDDRLTIHDFRMVTGPTHINVIFDVVVPFDFPQADNTLLEHIARMVKVLDANYFAVIRADRDLAEKNSGIKPPKPHR